MLAAEVTPKDRQTAARADPDPAADPLVLGHNAVGRLGDGAAGLRPRLDRRRRRAPGRGLRRSLRGRAPLAAGAAGRARPGRRGRGHLHADGRAVRVGRPRRGRPGGDRPRARRLPGRRRGSGGRRAGARAAGGGRDARARSGRGAGRPRRRRDRRPARRRDGRHRRAAGPTWSIDTVGGQPTASAVRACGWRARHIVLGYLAGFAPGDLTVTDLIMREHRLTGMNAHSVLGPPAAVARGRGAAAAEPGGLRAPGRRASAGRGRRGAAGRAARGPLGPARARQAG